MPNLPDLAERSPPCHDRPLHRDVRVGPSKRLRWTRPRARWSSGTMRAVTKRGLATAGRDVVGALVLSSWDAFLTVAQSADLDRSTRLPGWRAQEICVHLGVWDDYDALHGLLASARAGVGATPDVDTANA